MFVIILDDEVGVLNLLGEISHHLSEKDEYLTTSFWQTVDEAVHAADVMAKNHFSADVAIIDFDLVGQEKGNDAAKRIKAVSPTTWIVGNSGGDPKRFDRQFVDRVMPAKIKTPDEMKDAIYSRL